MKDLTLNDVEELRAALQGLLDGMGNSTPAKMDDAVRRARDVHASTDTLLFREPTGPFILSDHRVLLARELHGAGDGYRSVRAVLVDASNGTARPGGREYVAARHYGDDDNWTAGNYFGTLAQAAEKFDSMTADCEPSE